MSSQCLTPFPKLKLTLCQNSATPYLFDKMKNESKNETKRNDTKTKQNETKRNLGENQRHRVLAEILTKIYAAVCLPNFLKIRAAV